jgi:phosphopantothenoylcysteine decarboxylase/phosphopantothenate--cysteine ligase
MRVLLGVSGGIAAYKAAILVRRLQDSGHQVRCAITRSAPRFVSPLTLEVLTGHAVYSESYLEARGKAEEEHIAAAQWADVLCVAPATANTLARLSLGLAEDFLSTTALAFEGTLFVAPAMHAAMWGKPEVQENMARLQARGVRVLGPVEGALASGERGMGRMLEPEEIVAAIDASRSEGILSGRRVVISAGPTFESLDPVRFLGNRSSGRMGFALAEEAAELGAHVILVAGPVSLAGPSGVERVDVVDALGMEAAVYEAAADADLVIMAAAVSDFRPAVRKDQKIKKDGSVPSIVLVENPDILRGLADKAPTAVRVGFAAETENLEKNAETKLRAKDVDYLVANDVSRTDIGFDSESNEVTVYGRDGSVHHLSRRPKTEIARELLKLFARDQRLS